MLIWALLMGAVLEEQYLGSLLHVVQFATAPGVFVEDVVYVFEGLLEHLIGSD